MQFITTESELGLFSLRPQRDILTGISSGLQNIAKGLCAGTAFLFAAPILGYLSDGTLGMLQGVVSGVLGASIMLVTGTATGSIQVVRGVCSTPSAILENGRGKYWDNHQRTWCFYNLPVEKLLVDNIEPDIHSNETWREMYDRLDIKPSATQSIIKKAYYKKARKVHPDRNQEPNAGQRFKELSEAYQILSNTSTRAKYDQSGSVETTMYDATELFNIVFGSEKFESFIGELQIVAMYKQQTNSQWVREVNCAVYLADFLDNLSEIEKLANELSMGPCGKLLLSTIGHVYQTQSQQKYIDVYQVPHRTANYIRLLLSGVAAMGTLKKQHIQKNSNRRPEQHEQSIVLTALWNATVIDIESTLSAVCAKVLNDSSVSPEVIRLRIQRLEKVGKIFSDFGYNDVNSSVQYFIEHRNNL